MVTKGKTNQHADAIRRIVKGIDNLPGLPTTLMHIISTIGSDTSSAQDVSDAILNDQAITARVLKIANSAFYGLPRQITSVTAAIVVLGFNAVRNLIITAHVFDVFSCGRTAGASDRAAMWRHALETGIISQRLAQWCPLATKEEVFVAGLLHDLGEVVLNLYVPEGYADVVEYCKENHVPIVEAEQVLLGITHTEVGEMLATNWQLSEGVCQCICHHHTPANAEAEQTMVGLVHVADVLCRHHDGWAKNYEGEPHLDPEILDSLSIPPEVIEELSSPEIWDEINAMEEALFSAEDGQ